GRSCPHVARRDWKGRSAPLPPHPLEATPAWVSLWRLLRCCPPANGIRDGRLLPCSVTNVFDVKENMRATPITSYNRRCVVLPFHTIVDAPCLSSCNRG